MKIDARFGKLKLDIPRAGAVVARFCLEGAKIHVGVNANKTVSVQGQVGFLSGTWLPALFFLFFCLHCIFRKSFHVQHTIRCTRTRSTRKSSPFSRCWARRWSSSPLTSTTPMIKLLTPATT